MKRILFVDNEPTALQGLRLRLNRVSGKWELGWADNGPLAIEQMQRQSYDVVVTDLRIPGMDGATLLEIEIGAYLLGIWGLPYSVIEAVAYHHQPQRVSQSYFDVLAALTIAQSLVRADDGSAFDAAVPANSRVDESYLISVKAPFDWSEARRRVADTTESKEVAP
jgi:hypothetical protein